MYDYTCVVIYDYTSVLYVVIYDYTSVLRVVIYDYLNGCNWDGRVSNYTRL